MMTAQQVSNNTDPARNKYHTLTLAEAKKLNRSLATGSVNMPPPNHNPYLYSTIRRAPLRTASVLHKPRAPPIVVTDLDTPIDQLDGASLGNYPQHSSIQSAAYNGGSPERDKFSRSASIRSASLCPTGAAQFDSRRHTVNYGRSSTMNSRTSLYSVASSSVAQRQASNYDMHQPLQGRQHPQKTSLTEDNKASANSPRSVSKLSLSASTYRVFQSPFANFKRFFRNMPHPFSGNSDSDAKMESHFDINTPKSTYPNYYASKRAQCHDQSLGELSISDSISQISLNKSQSPPVCPPPPGQLKSMCYMESAINYSNYDEFTRSRNEKMVQRQQSIKDNISFTGVSHQSEDQHSLSSEHSEAWQLASLPLYYERNLTTVYEEKRNPGGAKHSEMVMSNNGNLVKNLGDQHQSMQHQHRRQNLIRPPIHFDDNSDTTLTSENINSEPQERQKQQPSQQVSSGSMQSLNSCLTTASAGQQLPPATPYRFSFAQPLKQADESSCLVDQVTFQKNIGLPPRMPTEHRLSINTSELTTSTRQDNSSSGNSSNCSSQLNGMNNCDRPNSLDAGSADKLSFNSNEDSTSIHTTSVAANNCSGFGNLNGLADNETDLTLLSETSTLQGDTGIAYYANKCAELERTVTSLKNKLISKEKELTDLQLNQLNNDYTIERLKKQVGRLERENAQLKTIVAIKS